MVFYFAAKETFRCAESEHRLTIFYLVLRFGTLMTELCIIKPNRRNRMKLAEALSIRADLQNRIDQLKSRLKYSAKVQEGDQPSENVNELFKELDECLS